jgi:hypothetical protein
MFAFCNKLNCCPTISLKHDRVKSDTLQYSHFCNKRVYILSVDAITWYNFAINIPSVNYDENIHDIVQKSCLINGE